MREYIDDKHLKVRTEATGARTLRRPLWLALLFCVVAGALLLLDVGGILSPVRSVLGQALNPVAQQLTNARNGVSDMFGILGNTQTVYEENERLRQENSQLESEIIALEQARVENTRLRQQLQMEEQYPWRLLGADVTMRSPDAVRRVFTIARGSQDGVQPGMAVVGQTGTGPVALVGIVEEVGPHTASVLLTTDFGTRVSVRVIHEGESALGLVQGQWQRGSRLRLEHVERQRVLEEGAIVVTAGLTGEQGFLLPMAAVPADVPIGEIEVVSSDGYKSFAELRPYADPDQVRYIWIILDQER